MLGEGDCGEHAPGEGGLPGDYFPAETRARNYGLILGGEMVGAGFGFEVSGNLAALLSWRWSFWVLVPPAVVLAVALRRWLPEPPRGGSLVGGGGSPWEDALASAGVHREELPFAEMPARHGRWPVRLSQRAMKLSDSSPARRPETRRTG